ARIAVGSSSTYFQRPSNFRCMKYRMTNCALATATASTSTATSRRFIGTTSNTTEIAVQTHRAMKIANELTCGAWCSASAEVSYAMSGSVVSDPGFETRFLDDASSTRSKQGRR